ncbi:zinc ribbon domain-containing protein [Aestuariimicrobium kwangyangense]|uniref:zinc ribbon domain-containing protein n=1 Tax=Aestuariimicrobium kwangyangense TaxID=396389 RepID=UPI0003B3367E|nr:zinc ribbon domain-containing protein [Aestuariimicrobium kwangyangense]
MSCPRCGTELPEAGHFCHACGHDLSAGDGARRSFAAKPDEPVRSFRLVSSIMPKGAAERPRTYQIAFGVSFVVAVVAALLGALPVAILVAALAIPLIYIVYLYDVNLWEDEPLPVTGLAFGLTFALAALFTVGWTTLRGPLVSARAFDAAATPTMAGVLITALLVPVVGELIRQVGPVVLAARPEFDDLMDGLTFGVISGVAFATADTLVKHWDLLGQGFHAPGQSAATWVALLVLEGFIKPLVIGTASGIACAEFSGLGKGYDGFTVRYLLAVLEAVAWNALYFGGTYLLSFVSPVWLGLVLSVVLGGVLLGALLIRIRGVLQTGLVEAALEATARHGAGGVGVEGDLTHCASCEMPLLGGAAFCSNCGLAQKSTVKGRLHPQRAVLAGAGPAPTAPDDARNDDLEARS